MGVGFLSHNCFDSNIQVLSNDPAGRCLVIKFNINSRSILLFNVYFPCFESRVDYRAEITYYTSFIESILDSFSHTDVIILGDTNFPKNYTNPGFVIMNSLLNCYNILPCDDLLSGLDQAIYVNVSLNCSSTIDHCFVS